MSVQAELPWGASLPQPGRCVVPRALGEAQRPLRLERQSQLALGGRVARCPAPKSFLIFARSGSGALPDGRSGDLTHMCGEAVASGGVSLLA
jgi:hypothetical protein